MSQQTSLRWKDHTLDELFKQLPEEHRRRAQRLLAHLIACAARETTTKPLRRAGCGGRAAIAGGEQGGAEQVADAGRHSLPLLVFDERGSDLVVGGEPELGSELQPSDRTLDGAVQTEATTEQPDERGA
jgi:hypothetical protein